MASIQTSTLLSSSFSCFSSKRVNAAIHVPKLPRVNFSVPKIPTGKLVEGLTFTDSVPLLENNVTSTQLRDDLYNSTTSKSTMQLYAILEAVADRVEMHKNIGEQRDNWNTLLLNNINMITLSAVTMAGVAAASGAGEPLLALKLSSTLLFSAATGMLLVMNKIQPSQLAEEQRNATKLFRKLQTQIQTTIALGNPTEEDVKGSMEKVLALDKAYPLPLLGAMLDKFPAKFEPAVWWPATQFKRESKTHKGKSQSSTHQKMEKRNGWSKELEMELREVIEVVKRKDIEDYERLGNIALKINKTLAIAGPLLTGIAAVGSGFVGNGSLAAIVPIMAGSLAAVINGFEHGGQVGMVFEMYRNCGGFFKLLEETIEATMEEKDLERRENGELFEMKMALQLGRSVSQLRELASKSASSRAEGIAVDEFASKLF
ncbi:probable F-box protein At4g22030 [Gastrolobium bilobum]|uniref:probable F-box protein At4g22030 n=1 Tax=Gastrolobium bilobum TaxID=150636 RepID=UPI002AAFECAB|nr:probable F-box protein At4g22030 [Gastrolobium bilobum]